VHRIYCVAKNYADHVREMGGTPEKDPPCFFTKPSDAIVWVGTTTSPESSSSPTRATPSIPYALATNQLEYEVELVIAIGSAGTNIQPTEALKHVFGYAVGIDLTRRDLQAQAKKGGRPWDSAKAFDQSAPIGSITQVFPEKRNEKEQERFKTAQIWLSVNEQVKQQGSVGDMIWNVPEIISALSSQFHLLPGDLIYTGTPSGVGPLVKGDRIKAGIDGLEPIEFTIA
jgi:fumarylpyruvate hydrolase